MPFTLGEPRISFETQGEDGPPVLLIMGLGMRGVVWEAQINDLSRDHRVVWFDNRGIGASEHAPTRYSVAHAADDAVRVLDTLGWDHAHVVGVSFGGMIAQELALRHHERLRSLVLIATHAGGPMGMVPTARGLRLFLRAHLGDRQRAMMSLLYPQEFVDSIDREALMARMAVQANQQPRQSVMRQLYAAARHDTRRRLARIAAPTLVMKPTQDILVRPMHSDRLATGIPGAKLHELQGGGHGAIFQCQAEVNAAIRAHVAAHADNPPRLTST
ncbi:MAG: alpha/beta fold hydrolase [Myxococcales bacterium]|nr:alpha/beta fold hydrolase [Myxococcales bacterium]